MKSESLGGTREQARSDHQTREIQAANLSRPFDQPYHGTAVKDFKDALLEYDRMYDPTNHFGRTIAIVQSSGTGKSRLVKELGNHFPSLSVCFRSTQEITTSWPPGDSPALEFFVKVGMRRRSGGSLPGAWVKVALDDITHERNVDKSVHDRLDAWGIAARANGGDSRHDRFIAVVELAEHRLIAEQQVLASLRKNLMSSDVTNSVAPDAITFGDGRLVDGESKTLQKGNVAHDKDTLQKSILTWHCELFELLAKPYFDQLGKILSANNIGRFLIAFDECTRLEMAKETEETKRTKKTTAPQWGMSLMALQRILKASDAYTFSGARFWFLLLDTASYVTDFAPPGRNVSSFRLRRGFISLPIWSCLGFDQLKPEGQDLPRKPKDAHFLEHLKKYGRPYWSTLEGHSHLLQGAILKLVYPDLTFSPFNLNHVFALFSNRVLLEVGSGPAATRLMAESVRTHMRLLVGVRAGNVVITKAASEPMLAVAAAQCLNTNTKVYQLAMETLIEKLVEQGLVLDRGVQGELSGRLLATFARDRAALTNADAFVVSSPDGLSIQPVTLPAFLMALVGKSFFDNERTVCARFLEDNDDVWINFTHFVQVEKGISTIDVDDLYDAWCRTAAIQCTHNQPIIDNLIVTYKGDLNAPFDKKNLQYVVFQLKAKAVPVSSTIADALVGPFISAKDAKGISYRYKPKGHLVVIMDLGATSNFQGERSRIKLIYGKAKRGDKGSSWAGYADTDADEAERYCLNVRGHDAKVYPLIAKFEDIFDKLFHRILACEQESLQRYADKMDVATNVLALNSSY
ncbi:hypothetical protein A0H81_10227 [Grifola frondosa]|uniref:Uncharacterized protein n=1 Tax=Grifola frondosa TaxID=5627 RepID=A0A1C7LY27_GRIFR|nr:hypothetical protein A0H81_10227 [Grifola frondosa]